MKHRGLAFGFSLVAITAAHAAWAAGDPSATAANPSALVATARPSARAYQLSWGIDLPLIAIGGVMAGARALRNQAGGPPAYCLTTPAGCDKSQLLFIDRPFAGRYDTNWSTFSDYAVVGVGVAPLVLMEADGRFVDGLNDSVVVYESGLLASALSSLSTLSTERARPYVYGDKAPASVRTSADGALSYFSGHTAFSFAIATSTFWTLERRHPHAAYPWIALGVGLGLATTIGIARVMAGKHFPTDVLAGAAVGASLGTLVPFLHRAPVEFSGTVDSHAASVDAYGRF